VRPWHKTTAVALFWVLTGKARSKATCRKSSRRLTRDARHKSATQYLRKPTRKPEKIDGRSTKSVRWLTAFPPIPAGVAIFRPPRTHRLHCPDSKAARVQRDDRWHSGDRRDTSSVFLWWLANGCAVASYAAMRCLLTAWFIPAPFAECARRPINARAKTLTTSGMFRSAFARRRCLLPANAIYEWKAIEGEKQPYAIARQTVSQWRSPVRGGIQVAGRYGSAHVYDHQHQRQRDDD
jgi:hypothetical protein